MLKGNFKKSFSIGICAHNEEANISYLLDAIGLQNSEPFFLKEIIITASACTDKTCYLIKKHPLQKKIKVRLFTEKTRKGKASAVNILLHKCKTDFLILESADTLPDLNTYKYLLQALSKPEIGLVTARIKPIKVDKKTLVGFANWLMWELHHEINLGNPNRPKVGEIFAFKRTFRRIPEKTATDEANIELLILGQGYKIIYLPKAIIYNKGPETIREFLSRRRSNYYGHTKLAHEYGYQVVTLNLLNILLAYFKKMKWSPVFIIKSTIVVFLELTARLTALIDYKFSLRDHSIWKIASSTKKLK